MKMKINFNTIISLLGLILISMLITLALNSHPSFDDYAWPVLIKEMGWLNTQNYVYHSFNGRVLSTFSSTLIMTDPNFFIKYKLFGLLFLLSFLIGLFKLITLMINKEQQLKKIHFSFFSIVLFSVFIIIPDSSSLFFWLTGVIVYFTTLILFLLLLSCFEIIDQNNNPKIMKRHIYFSIIICASIPLFSEMGVFLISPLLIYKICFERYKLKKWNLFLLSLIFVLGFSMVINYLGSQTRMTNLKEVTHNQDLFKSFSLLIQSLTNYLFSYYSLSLLFVNISIFYFIQLYNVKKNSLFGIDSPYILMMLGIVTFVLGLFVSIFILGVEAPQRVWNILIVSMQFFFISAYVVYKTKNEIKISYKRFIMIFFFFISMTLPNTFRQMTGDLLKGNVFFYNKFMNKQYEYSKKNKTDTLYLEKIKSTKLPISIMFKKGTGLAEDSKSEDWFYNVFYAKYFKKKIVYPKK
jgi:hypothetical protein